MCKLKSKNTSPNSNVSGGILNEDDLFMKRVAIKMNKKERVLPLTRLLRYAEQSRLHQGIVFYTGILVMFGGMLALQAIFGIEESRIKMTVLMEESLSLITTPFNFVLMILTLASWYLMMVSVTASINKKRRDNNRYEIDE
jgi:hypothetical protein